MSGTDVPALYPALLRAGWAKAVVYRGQILLWVLTFLFPLIMMAVWLSVVGEVGPVAGLDRADFASYYVAAAVVQHLTLSWTVWEWDEDIRTGSLSVKLLKPLDPFHTHLTTQLGVKLLLVVVLLPVVVAVTWLNPLLDYRGGPGRWLLVAAAVAAGYLLNLLMSCAFGVLAFWSTQARSLYGLWSGVGFFLSGWIAPLDLFPGALRDVAVVLPFRSSLGFPVELALGRLSAGQVALGFTVSAAWVVVFGAAYRILWHRGLRRYEAVGA